MSLVDDAIAAAKRAGIDPGIFVRQIEQESGFNPNARSPAGAEGIAQFMPAMARALGINPWDPVAALNAAAQYMAYALSIPRQQTPVRPQPLFKQPQVLSVPRQQTPTSTPKPAPKPKTIFGLPFAFSVPRQPVLPLKTPKATRPSPAPKPKPKLPRGIA